MTRAEVWLGTTLAVLVFLPRAGSHPPSSEPGPARSLAQRYNRARTLQARFVQRYTFGRTTRIESGSVYFQKPARMRWEYDPPDAKVFLSDGRDVYLYVPGERQVSRRPVRESADWRTPFGLLLGRVDFKKLFSRVETKTTHRPAQPPLTQLRGLPRSPRQGFTEVWIDLNPKGQLERIEIRQPDGALMEFHFRDWRENQPLPPDLFRLRVPRGTVWLDMPPA